MPIAWTESLSVSIPKIDEQHKKLIEIINDLEEAVNEQKGKEVTEALFQELADYIDMHFGTEEKYMLKLNYMGYDFHKDKHNEFTSTVRELRSKAIQQKKDVTLEALEFLGNWFKDHITVVDGELGAFLRQHKAQLTEE